MTVLRSSFIAFFCLFSLTSAASLATQTPLDAVDNLSDKWSWKDCGMETDPIQIQSIEISPDPPLPGKPLTVKVTGTASEVIEEGATADVTVKLGLIKLLTKTFDVCEEARSANASVQCPVEKGQYVVEQTVDLPKEIPPAKFNIHIDGYTVDDDDLMCMDLTIDFTKKHFW
ncbi:ML domain-containing protein [Lentinula edodes]|uniref:Phosphatidylglycerol/phosphatidylinositol transfer protein n=1 Tax=Lentinula lateritia TaxID=40482 RepID=A0A9W9DWE9_9AGAR|nr:ML domain-containing protein [Lentinula edodes]KAJ3895019.1 ML domain-containing protein [Lentinula edodes]KAJ4489338.1 ML domain-containing protein [Lentinula edodes]